MVLILTCWNIRSKVFVPASPSTRGTYYIYPPTYNSPLKCQVYTPRSNHPSIEPRISNITSKYHQPPPNPIPQLLHSGFHSPSILVLPHVDPQADSPTHSNILATHQQPYAFYASTAEYRPPKTHPGHPTAQTPPSNSPPRRCARMRATRSPARAHRVQSVGLGATCSLSRRSVVSCLRLRRLHLRLIILFNIFLKFYRRLHLRPCLGKRRYWWTRRWRTRLRAGLVGMAPTCA
jgi:hypothetical protein